MTHSCMFCLKQSKGFILNDLPRYWLYTHHDVEKINLNIIVLTVIVFATLFLVLFRILKHENKCTIVVHTKLSCSEYPVTYDMNI